MALVPLPKLRADLVDMNSVKAMASAELRTVMTNLDRQKTTYTVKILYL